MHKNQELFTITSRDAECWSVSKKVEGICNCFEDGSSIYIDVNGKQFPVIIMGNQFHALLFLEEGENKVTGHCVLPNGTEYVTNSIVYTLRLADRPQAQIGMEVVESEIVLTADCQPSEVSGAKLNSFTWQVANANPQPVAVKEPLVEWGKASEISQIRLEVPTTDGEYYFYLTVGDEKGKQDRAGTYFKVEQGVARQVGFPVENPRWIEDAIVYGVVPHNFGKQGFKDVTNKLDYLKDLGINTIWLAPSNHTPNVGGHSYNVTNYFEVRADYGTKEDLKELVATAHQKGIRVLMDFVPNHTAIEHRYMQDSVEHGFSSPYYDFYQRDENGNPVHYFDWDNLPNLNFDNPEVFRWITEAMAYWVREFDVDGYRVDVAWGLKQRRPDFWPQLRRELQRIKPDMFLLAEASARDPYYFTEGFDGAYDWTEELGHWSMEKVFEEKDLITSKLHNALTNHGRGLPEDALVFRFLNNNDTGARFVTRYGSDVKQVAAAMLLTLPGTPCIYTGEEGGVEFEPYFTPDPIEFTDEKGTREYYKQLIQLRKELPSLRSRNWQPLQVSPQEAVYAYLRYQDSEVDEPVVVVLNYSDKTLAVDLELPDKLQEMLVGRSLTDRLSNESIRVSDEVKVAVNPWQARIFQVSQDN